MAKMIINDWQRGVISYFYPPPSAVEDAAEEAEVEAEAEAEADEQPELGALKESEAAAVPTAWRPSLNSAV